MIEIKTELIDELIQYIEHVTIQLENEFGVYRNIEELIKIDEMPDVYYTLVELKRNDKQS